MQSEQYVPTGKLRPFIKAFLFIECEAPVENCILPDTAVVMSFRYKGHVGFRTDNNIDRLPLVMLSGIRKMARQVCYEAQSANLLVVFRPGAAAAFFQEPLHELSDQHLEAGYLKNYKDFSTIAEQLSQLSSNKERAAFIEKVLLDRLIKPAPDPLVAAAIVQICATGGNKPVRELSRELYLSQDAFGKRFRSATGTSAKHFSSIIRLRHAIHAYTPGKSLTHTALDAGYYDQAHFINDFKSFTGKAPGLFFREGRFW